MKIYFVAPLFSEAEKRFNQNLAEKLEGWFRSVFISKNLKNIGSNYILQNRQFVFALKIQYKLVAESFDSTQGKLREASRRNLTFPFWCPRESSFA